MIKQMNQSLQNIVAIGGGKGGVGKTIITANLGLALANAGYKVILVDADLGSANLHSFVGIIEVNTSLEDFVEKKKKDINEVIIKTKYNNLSIICGAFNIVGIANPAYQQKLKIIRALNKIEFDYLIVDLGAGVSYSVLDFFNMANEKIIIVTPQFTSLQNSYSFLKNAFFRNLIPFLQDLDSVFTRGYFKELLSDASYNLNTFLDIVDDINPELKDKILEFTKNYQTKIIGNMVENQNELSILTRLPSIVQQNLMLPSSIIGFLKKSNQISNSINKLTPYSQIYPDSPETKEIKKITNCLTQKTERKSLRILKGPPVSELKITEDYMKFRLNFLEDENKKLKKQLVKVSKEKEELEITLKQLANLKSAQK